MGTPPRLAPTTEADWDDETRALLDALGRLNIFTTLAHHPKLLKRWLVFGGHVLAKSTLPDRERELLILRVGWRCGSEYEFGQHTVIGRRLGLTDDEIRRLATDGPRRLVRPTTPAGAGRGRARRRPPAQRRHLGGARRAT